MIDVDKLKEVLLKKWISDGDPKEVVELITSCVNSIEEEDIPYKKDYVVFLDIDGVLNSEYDMTLSGDFKQGHEFAPRAIEQLNVLVESTGAKVVVSSTWRRGKTIEELEELLKSKGFTGKVIGKTPDGLGYRGIEIKDWLDRNYSYEDMPKYVILDDDSDMLYGQTNNFVHVDSYCGLTYNNVRKAIFILTGKYK